MTLSVLFQCRWFYICFIQTWAYLWVICILMVFFRKYKWLFLVIKSVIKPWVLKKFSFALRAHIQRIDSYLSIYSCWKYKSLKNLKNKKSIWIEHSQICMQQLKISFFRLQTLKNALLFWRNFWRIYLQRRNSVVGSRTE